nr:hypothetical protein CFP56_43441 [Quercus suber]
MKNNAVAVILSYSTNESSSHALNVLEEGGVAENGRTTECLEPKEDSFNYKPSSSNFDTDSENFFENFGDTYSQTDVWNIIYVLLMLFF